MKMVFFLSLILRHNGVRSEAEKNFAIIKGGVIMTKKKEKVKIFDIGRH